MGEHESTKDDDVGRRWAIGRAQSQYVSHSIEEASRRAEAVSFLQKPELESGLRLVFER